MSALAKALRGLENAERTVAALVLLEDRDDVIVRLIEAIEHDRAELLAAIISGRALSREPRWVGGAGGRVG